MQHEVAESVLYLIALALLAGAAASAWRGPAPAGRYLAGHLAINAILLLDRLGGGRTTDAVEIVLVSASTALLVLFVAHVPRRRTWLPTGGRGEALFAAVLFVLLIALYGFGRMPQGVGQEDLVWRYFPVMLIGALLPGLVALIFILDAQRAAGRAERRALVWLALAFAFAAAESAYRVRLIAGSMAGPGPDPPEWVLELNRMVLASYGGGLAILAAAALVAGIGIVWRRDAFGPYLLFVTATCASALLGDRFAAWAFQTTGPSGLLSWVVLLRTLDDLALATLGTWGVIRLAALRRTVRPKSPEEVSLEVAFEPPAADPEQRGDPGRFHPRLGLDEQER